MALASTAQWRFGQIHILCPWRARIVVADSDPSDNVAFINRRIDTGTIGPDVNFPTPPPTGLSPAIMLLLYSGDSDASPIAFSGGS